MRSRWPVTMALQVVRTEQVVRAHVLDEDPPQVVESAGSEGRRGMRRLVGITVMSSPAGRRRCRAGTRDRLRSCRRRAEELAVVGAHGGAVLPAGHHPLEAGPGATSIPSCRPAASNSQRGAGRLSAARRTCSCGFAGPERSGACAQTTCYEHAWCDIGPVGESSLPPPASSARTPIAAVSWFGPHSAVRSGRSQP